MIKSFRSADTRVLFETGKSKRFGAIIAVATRKLTQLEAAATLEFLRAATKHKNGMRPVHPGEVLREEFLRPAGLTARALARSLHVPAPRINDIVRERRGVSADTAMRLARYFGGEAHSWLNLQAIYDLRLAEIANARKIEREIMPIAV